MNPFPARGDNQQPNRIAAAGAPRAGQSTETMSDDMNTDTNTAPTSGASQAGQPPAFPLAAGSLADFADVPKGLYLLRMFHERTGKHCLHIGLKLHDGAWHEQPSTPFYSEEATSATCAEFWEWATKSLPIYEYPNLVKSSL